MLRCLRHSMSNVARDRFFMPIRWLQIKLSIPHLPPQHSFMRFAVLKKIWKRKSAFSLRTPRSPKYSHFKLQGAHSQPRRFLLIYQGMCFLTWGWEGYRRLGSWGIDSSWRTATATAAALRTMCLRRTGCGEWLRDPCNITRFWGDAGGSSISWVAKLKGDKKAECNQKGGREVTREVSMLLHFIGCKVKGRQKSRMQSKGGSRSYKRDKHASFCRQWGIAKQNREVNQDPNLPGSTLRRFLSFAQRCSGRTPRPATQAGNTLKFCTLPSLRLSGVLPCAQAAYAFPT